MNLTELSTEDRLIAQLTENTGRALMDSGGTPKYDEEGNYTGSTEGYGRAYERDKNRAFKDDPVGEYDAYKDEIVVALSTYHFLMERAQIHYNPEMDKPFQQFMNECDSYGMSAMEEYIDHLIDLGHDIGGIYGQGMPQIVNTYNGESILDRVLQFIYFEMDGDAYVLLQTHNGADVRGGYSTPVLYEIDALEPVYIFMVSDATLYAGDRYWWTDDGYHWYEEGGTAGTNLEDMPFNAEAEDENDSEEDIIWLSEEDPDVVYIWDNNAYVGGHKVEVGL